MISRPFALAAFVVMPLATSAPAALAQTRSCTLPPIQECPTLYEDRCRNDKTFRTSSDANSEACLSVILGEAQDQPHCAQINASACEPVACDDPDMHPLKRFYCENGFPDCPVNITVLEQGFQDVLTNLNTTLAPYEDLIALDPGTLGSQAELCQYSTNEISSFEERARVDSGSLGQYTQQLQDLRQCNTLIGQFMEAPPPENISDQLWASIKGSLVDQIQAVATQEGSVKSRIEELEQSPQKIADLSFVHQMVCPASE